jgi:hypothetical protein
MRVVATMVLRRRPKSGRLASRLTVPILCLVLVFAACSSNGPVAPSGVFLPRLTGAPPQYGAAAIEGTLVENRGCLELTDLYMSAEFAPPSPSSVVLPLWPEGSKATRTDDGTLRVDAPGLPPASTGQRVFLGGIFTPSREDAEQKVGELIPVDCRVGLYWVANQVHS